MRHWRLIPSVRWRTASKFLACANPIASRTQQLSCGDAELSSDAKSFLTIVNVSQKKAAQVTIRLYARDDGKAVLNQELGVPPHSQITYPIPKSLMSSRKGGFQGLVQLRAGAQGSQNSVAVVRTQQLNAQGSTGSVSMYACR